MNEAKNYPGIYENLIINVALTGAIPMKSDYSSLPIEPSEIAEDVARCFEAGARVFHIHMRDGDGKQTHDQKLYEETIGLIRKTCPEAIVCTTTTSRGGATLEERKTSLLLQGNLKPEFASLSLGSFNFRDSVSLNPPIEISELLSTMNEHSVRPELEVFEPGMVCYAKNLIENHLLVGTPVFNMFLGLPTTSDASLLSASSFLGQLPYGSEWAFAGIGRHQLPVAAMSISAGGNVRVGMEDSPSIFGDKDWSNLKAVSWAADFAKTIKRDLATPEEARERLGIKQ